MDNKSNQRLDSRSQRAGTIDEGGRGKQRAASADDFVEDYAQIEGSWNEGGGQDPAAVTQAMRHREVGGGSPGQEMPGGYASFKTNSNLTDSQNDGEPGRCPDSSLRTDGVDDKVRLIHAKEIIAGH